MTKPPLAWEDVHMFSDDGCFTLFCVRNNNYI